MTTVRLMDTVVMIVASPPRLSPSFIVIYGVASLNVAPPLTDVAKHKHRHQSLIARGLLGLYHLIGRFLWCISDKHRRRHRSLIALGILGKYRLIGRLLHCSPDPL
ncbi:hypothetical protein BaRGS_00038511 [Batillaria attramentaria]|uniref:Uncharacterized protein n=1 Tax=Batillaria attramentaria TaxID=370345 RepID=A0ABD0J671_9CAEN